MYNVVVIGAGMAGLTSAIYVARAGKAVLVLESGAIGGQIMESLKVENWPGEVGISGPNLMNEIQQQVDNLNVKIENAEVVSVKKSDSNSFIVETDEGEYACDSVIIATGTIPRRLSESQMREVGDRPVSYCATCDGALYKGKPVVVIGSGNTAKYEMKYLGGIASKVYHIHHDDSIPEDAAAVFVAIGRVPNTGLFEGLVNTDKDGYIVAGEDCRTSCPGVFVAGDCRTKAVRQLVTAAGDGAIAAEQAIRYSDRKDSREQ